MSTRSRALALDGHSVEADVEQTDERVSRVQVAILGRFAELGPLTDDELIRAYETARVDMPDIPAASPQGIRSRRAELAHRGIVRATTIPGLSAYGRAATVWALASTERQPSALF